MDWWTRHVGHTSDYAKAVKGKDTLQKLSAFMHLVDGVAQWGQIIAKKTVPHNGIIGHGLMAEHVIGAKLLADRTPVADQAMMNAGLNLLAANADAQATFLAAAIPGFPYAEFRKLLGVHLEATNGYIGDITAVDEPSFHGHMAAARKNAMDLDQFTEKNLL